MIKKTSFFLICLILFISLCHCAIKLNQPSAQYQNWKFQHKVSFSKSSQDRYRMQIFKKNYQKILEHNQKPNQTYKMGVNKFTILTQQQFQQLYLMKNIYEDIRKQQKQLPIQSAKTNKRNNEIQPLQAIPPIDWVLAGGVTPIQDQGQCGSCWAFNSVALVQSFLKIKDKTQYNLSQQQILDCTSKKYGCNGGLYTPALNYIRINGITNENSYPYIQVKNRRCRINSGSFRISQVLSYSGCANILTALTQSPVAVAVGASFWSGYQEGIFNNCNSQINHAVLVVGNDQNGVWKIKNSWGADWGEKGYIRLAAGNSCGICVYAANRVL